MGLTLTVTSKTGALKKIAAEHLKVGGSFNAAYNHASAVVVTPDSNEEISLIDREFLLLSGGEEVTLEFQPDNAGSNGQGMYKLRLSETYTMELTSVTGSVYIVDADDTTITDSHSDLWGETKTAATGTETLDIGDHVLCAALNSYFSVKFTADANTPIPIPPPVSNALAMAGLEEGCNEINAS